MKQPTCQRLAPLTGPRTGALGSLFAAGRAGVWSGRNTRCGIAATLAALACIAGGARVCTAQPTGVPDLPENRAAPAASENRASSSTTPLATASVKTGLVVTPDHAMAGYALVERWVREWRAPVAGDMAAELGARVRGAAITLRRGGQIIGRGTAITLDAAAPGSEATPALVLAAIDALREAEQRLPGDRDAFREDRLRALAPEIAISVEVCGEPAPFVPLAFDEVDRELAPGLDGVAARIGSRVAGVFPAAMLVRNVSPGDALAACIAQAADDPGLGIRSNPQGQPPDLKKSHEAVFYRFRALHVAQSSAGQPARFMHRGGRVVDGREITGASLHEWAAGLAGHLERLTVIEPADASPELLPEAAERMCLTMSGTRWPTSGRTDLITPANQAVCALALDRFGRVEGAGTRGIRASAVARRLTQQILVHVPVPAEPAAADIEAITRAAVLASVGRELRIGEHVSRTPPGPLDQGWDPAERLARLRMVDDPASPANALNTSARGMLAWDLALGGDALAAAHVRALYKTSGLGSLHAAMPWIGWADQACASAAGTQPATALLREWRDAVYMKMLPATAPGADGADLAGGFVFSASAAPTLAPSAQGAGTVSFLASMLRDPSLTDAKERPKELSRLLSALRFLRQLSIDEYSAYSAMDRDGAMWGVRRTLWDQRLDPEHTAMVLIAVCETIESLEAMKK